MMKKSIDSPFRKLKMLLVLPLIAMVFYAFAKPEYISLPATTTGTHTITTIADALNELKASNNAPVDKSEKVTPVEKSKIVKGKVVNADGKPWPGTTVIVKGTTSGAMTDKEGYFELKDVSKDGVLIFSFVGYQTVQVKPDFKKSMTIKMVPAVVGLDKVVVVGYVNPNAPPPPPPPAGVAFNSADFSNNPPLIFLDGVIIDKAKMDAIDQETIASIDVLKDKSATDKYGDKGKNGVIEITTKGNPNKYYNKKSDFGFIDKNTNDSIRVSAYGNVIFESTSLFILDGIITDISEINKIDPESIKYVTHLKDKDAIEKYGEKGKNGVTLITTKKNQGASNGKKEGDVEVVGFGKSGDSKPNDPALSSFKEVSIRSNVPQNPPLYVLDGVIIPNMDAINPNDIASVNILKAKSATDLYGEKGGNGVILITSKGKAAASADQKVDKATKSETKGKEVFIVVEEMPEFPGGKEALMKFIQTNIKYPAKAQKAKAQGTVLVTFLVNSNGKVEFAKVTLGVNPALDAEAMRVIGLLPLQPNWEPARQRGVAVDVAYTLPIEFKLQ